MGYGEGEVNLLSQQIPPSCFFQPLVRLRWKRIGRFTLRPAHPRTPSGSEAWMGEGHRCLLTVSPLLASSSFAMRISSSYRAISASQSVSVGWVRRKEAIYVGLSRMIQSERQLSSLRIAAISVGVMDVGGGEGGGVDHLPLRSPFWRRAISQIASIRSAISISLLLRSLVVSG